jgi:hypothetical protein
LPNVGWGEYGGDLRLAAESIAATVQRGRSASGSKFGNGRARRIMLAA